MPKPSVKLNQPQKALNRDQNNLGEADYSTLINGLFDGIDGGTFTLTNEMSNLLSSKFKEGFKVINATNDIYSNNTYFFLTNPTNGIGEIGQIKNIQQVVNLEDTISDCVGCVKHLDLAQPLENQVQTALNVYQTLLTDECHILAGNPKKGFQFSINFPIKKTLIKNEKCGKTIYFTDNNVDPRYVILDKLSQYQYTGDIICGVDQRIATCLDADKLPIFRKYNLPTLTPTSIQLGGRLKLGVYQFLIAYCDQLGNEISEYVSITNPVQIFDRNNITLEQKELGTPTNFSIKLEVKNLDLRFSHYKIAVIENTLESVGASQYFIEGIHTINDNTVVYGGSDNKPSNITLSDLLRENIFIEKWELLAESNNSLIGVGLTVEKEINLQPIVNLLPLKWQTHIAQEDLYKDGVNVSKYLGYNRDEVVPFSIRFLLQGGYKTALFPLINRNAQASDLVVVPQGNKDRASIESNKTRCVTSVRDKYWQYYNTAKVDNGFCVGEEIELIEVDEEIQKICTIENVFTIPASTYIIEIDEDFTDLRTYIEDNKEQCLSIPVGSCPNILPLPPTYVNTFPFCNYLDPDCYANSNCTPLFNDQRVNNIVVGGEYIIYQINVGDNFVGTGYTTSGVVFTALIQPIVWNNDTEVFKNSCTTPVKQSEEIIVGKIIGNSTIGEETVTKIESLFPSEYEDIILKNNCSIYKSGDYDGIEVDTRANPFFIPAPGTSSINLMSCGQLIIVRDLQSSNFNPSSADIIQNISSNISNAYLESYFNDYDISPVLTDLYDTKIANPVASGWVGNLHKKALWFKTDTTKNRFILEITPQKNIDIPRDDLAFGTSIRMSLYAKKNSTNPFFTRIVDLTNGAKFLFEKNLITGGYTITDEAGLPTPISPTDLNNSKFYVVTDCRIIEQFQSIIVSVADPFSPNGILTTCSSFVVSYRIAPTNGCYSIVTREIEYSRAEVSFTSIILNKIQTYTSICTFQKPILNSCKATPYKKGTFSFWQSEETYPDNSSLYNSAVLKVKPIDIPLESRLEFETNFVITTNILPKTPILDTFGNYQWKLDNTNKPLVNYTCRGIQHFKFPDNKISPLIYENQQLSQSNAVIYPLGVTVDENTINAYLDLAVKNSLISQEKRNLISGYEIFRGNIEQDRSIQCSGFLFNMRSYIKFGEVWQYSNYPYNDQGKDKLNLDGGVVSNTKYTFHSPETDYYKPTLPSELSVQGYMFGQTTNNVFEEVKDYPKMVVLSNKARNLANVLAGLEVATEIAVNIAASAEAYRAYAGLVFSLNPVGIGMNIATSIASGLSGVVVNYGRYRLDWLKAFRDLGQPQQFAYYNHSSANYNYLQALQKNEQQLRGLHQVKYLKDKDTTVVDDVTGQKLNINNLDREKSVLITLGENNPLIHPTQYTSFDNNIVNSNTGSISYASDSGACTTGKSKNLKKNVASPYVALKNYLPSQYGTMNSINWLSTGYRGNLKSPTFSCVPIFGGDTFISRHTVKRKIPLFAIDNFGLNDLTPMNHKKYSNIGSTPRFFIEYETGDTSASSTIKGRLFPDINYDFNFDCTNKNGMYYKSPSKFYLYYYGVPSFLTETRINTWNRTARVGIENNFFPNTGDTGELTQQKNVPISRQEQFFYDSTYSRGVDNIARRTLYDNFDQIESNCRQDSPNGAMISLPDNSENNYNDPNLIFRPLDRIEFPLEKGKINDIRTIEREQILVRQENATSLYNALDMAIDDGKSPETRNLVSMFARRPMTYFETDLGHGGTQSTQSVSCEYGHFHVDAKRGQIIHIATGGQNAEDIASTIGGLPSGMRNWFKEHLPFKILKSKIVGVENIDTDNAYNGIGIAMGYDSRFKRIFITKKDYIVKPLLSNQTIEFEDFKFYVKVGLVRTEIKLTNTTYFSDVSFTIAYSPSEQKFIGWYSYTPNYYINHQNYFQTGLNNSSDISELGLWSHLLTNRSYQVFYGKKYPFIVDYMLKRTYGEMLLKSVGFDMNVVRYHNEYDAAEIDDKPFNKAWIYSPFTNSGQLNLIPNTGQISLISAYPKTNADHTEQDILVTKVHNEYTFNYFYNRMLSHKSNNPTWLFDKNQINKKVNPEIVKFGNKLVLEPMRSNVFNIRLEQSAETRLRYSINLLSSKLNLGQ